MFYNRLGDKGILTISIIYIHLFVYECVDAPLCLGDTFLNRFTI